MFVKILSFITLFFVFNNIFCAQEAITSAGIKTQLTNFFENSMPKELINIISQYANPEFENKYNILLTEVNKIVEENIEYCDLFTEGNYLKKIRQLRLKLQKLNANSSLIDDVLNLEYEVAYTLYWGTEQESRCERIINALKKDYNRVSGKDLLIECDDTDDEDIEFKYERVTKFLIVCLLKKTTSEPIGDLLKLYQKLSTKFTQYQTNQWKVSEYDQQLAAKEIKESFANYNEDKFLKEFIEVYGFYFQS